MLAGVGVPDLRGSQSKGTFYTQDRTASARKTSNSFFWIRAQTLPPA